MRSEFYCLVTGSQSFVSEERLSAVLDKLLMNHTTDKIYIVTGNDKGTDQLAQAYAEARGYVLKVFYADWATYHKYAGKVRNEYMIGYVSKQEHNGAVFFTNGDNTGAVGFKISKARDAGIPVKIIWA